MTAGAQTVNLYKIKVVGITQISEQLYLFLKLKISHIFDVL